MTADGKAYLEKLSGMMLKDDVSFVLNPSDLVHIHNRHFGNNEHDGRNIPLTKDDIRAIASIVSNPSRIVYAKEKTGSQRNLFFFLKILLLKRIIFITVKKITKMMSVRMGFSGASVARNIMGKPKTMAGKF